MKKDQPRFRMVLVGLIAAVAGGLAVYVALNIDWGIPRVGGEDIDIGITLEQYEADLKQREQEVTEQLKQAQAEEGRDLEVLEKEKTEIERRLADTESGYQSYIEELKGRIDQLEAIRGQVSDRLLEQTRDALARGDRSQADELLNRIEARTEAAVQAAAETAYQHSRIALDEIRYPAAYEHTRRAVRLAPENSLYLTHAGELAWLLGNYAAALDYHERALADHLKTYGEDHPQVANYRNKVGSLWGSLVEYQKAIGHYEQALVGGLKAYGEDHPQIAVYRTNLGAAWQGFGEHQRSTSYHKRPQTTDEYHQAIGYYEQALAGDLATYGEDHPDVARDRNNLGSAWQDLGEYHKAIGYFEQALAGDLATYGGDHPDVARDRTNLGSAWQDLGEYQKAIGYFEQALPVFTCKLGPEHPYTKETRDHLTTARAAQGGTDTTGGE